MLLFGVGARLDEFAKVEGVVRIDRGRWRSIFGRSMVGWFIVKLRAQAKTPIGC